MRFTNNYEISAPIVKYTYICQTSSYNNFVVISRDVQVRPYSKFWFS